MLRMVMITFLSVLGLMTSHADLKKYTADVWKSPNGGEQPFRFRTPDEVKSGKKYPLVVFLHGAGGRRADNKGQLEDVNTVNEFERIGISSKYQAYVYAPQVPKHQRWVEVDWGLDDHRMPEISEPMRMMFENLYSIVKDPKNQIDKKRIYLVGISMGGYGTWDALQRKGKIFAAAIPMCGGGDKELAKRLVNIPIWTWHGDKDRVIKVGRSRDMVAAIKAAGGTKIQYSEIKRRTHNVWVDCFKSDELWEWLFEQKKQ